MKREILVNATPRETRVAIIEDDLLVELLVDRPDARRMVGDVYLGKVEAVLPGIQAAFVNIGTEKAAFLHASDIVVPDAEPEEDDDDEDDDAPSGGGRRERRELPPFRTCSSAARISSCRSPRSRSAPRGRASRRRCRWPAASRVHALRQPRRREPQDR
jgi:ribonuclease G